MDSEEYQMFLREKLKIACSAFALSQEAVLNPKLSPDPLDRFNEILPACSNKIKKGTSREFPNDENVGEIDLEKGLDAKRLKRMISNRESARRSRRIKQEQLIELETQVAQLRDKNYSLNKKLAHMTEKYSEATVTNRILRADIETLKAKVIMTEEMMNRIRGVELFRQELLDISATPIAVPDRIGKAPPNLVGEFGRSPCR